MTTIDYLKHRLGDKISQTINIENIHVINGKVTLVGKGECHATKNKTDNIAVVGGSRVSSLENPHSQ